jgi:hypothetical protein
MRWRMAIIMAGLALALAAPGVQSLAQTITPTSTFNNLGVVVELGAAAPPDARVRMFQKRGGAAAGEFREVHPLSRLSPVKFAGSAFGLDPGTAYDFKLTSPAFAADQFFTAATRSEVFPDATNATRHVSPLAGNDSDDGTSLARAFRTLAKALSVAAPGTTILLHDGTYYEGDLSAARSGAPSAPIVIANAPGASPVLDGTDTNFVPAWTVFDAAHHVYRTPCASVPENAYLNGGQFFHYLVLADLLNRTWDLPGGYHADGAFLYARFPNDTATGTNVVTIPAHTTGITLSQKSWLQFRGLEFRYYGKDSFHRGIYIDGGVSNLVDGCFFHHNGVGVALKRAASFNTIQHCTFTEFPLATWAWSAVKEGGGDYEAGGVVIYGSPQANRGNVIRHCTFTNLFDGAHLYSEDASGPTENLDFHNNVIEECGDDGIETDGAGSNCRIYFNRFRGFLTGVSVAPAAIGPTYVLRNALSGWRRTGGYDGYPFKFNVSSSLETEWVYLYHNTCFTDVPGQPGFLFKEYSNWTNVISRNNVFAGTAYALENWETPNPVDLDYDDLYTTHTAPRFSWGSVRYDTVGDFAVATGQEAHGISVPPGFVDAAAHDFYPAADSALIDRALALPGINDDPLGSAPDIGAWEFGMEAEGVWSEAGAIVMNWHVGAFGTFALDYTTQLSPPDWRVQGTPIQAESPFLRIRDAAPADSRRFYRLRHVAP